MWPLAAAAQAPGSDSALVLLGGMAESRQLIAVLGLAGLVIMALLAALVTRNRQLAASRRRLTDALVGHNSILANLPDPVWLKDTAGVYLACNPAFERMYGAPEARIIGKTDADFVGITATRDARKQERAAVEAGRALDNEEWVTFGNDGHSALLLITRVPMYDDQGQLIGVLGIGRDITEQRKTERELRRRESYQTALLDNFPFMVWLKDTEGRYLAVNQRVAAAAGCESATDLIGKTDLDVWPEDVANACRAHDREVMTRRHRKETIEEIAEARGQSWVETFRCPVLDLRGELLGTVGFARDVSQRMAVERVVRDSEARFRAFFEHNSSVMLLIDPVERLVVGANAAAARFYGYDIAEMNDMPVTRINALDDAQIAAAMRTVQHGIEKRFLFPHRLASGEIRDVEVYSTPISSEGRDLLFSIVHDVTERMRAERELAEERDLFSAGPVVVLTWTPDAGWPVQHVSSNAEPVLGYGVDEMIDPAFRFIDLVHPDDRERVEREVEAFLDQGADRFEQSYRLRHKEHGYAWFHGFNLVRRDAHGRLETIRGYLFDKTEQRDLEMSLQAQRQRLEWVIEGTRAGTWEWNVQTGETRFNARWAEIVGYTLAELGPLTIDTWTGLAHPDDLQRSTELLQRHFAGETDFCECEARMRHKDGSWVWVLDRGRVFEWTDDGRPLWMAGTHQDITARKQAEQGLRDVERRQRVAGKVAYDLIYEWDVDKGSLEWFGDIDGLLGYRSRELPHDLQAWLDLIHPDDRPAVEAGLPTHHADPTPYQYEYRVRHRNGGYRVWLDKGAPLTDDLGRVCRWVGVCSDITEHMRAAEKQRLAATVFSHASEGIMITNAEGDIVDVNEAFSVITGFSREEALGENPRFLRSGRHDRAFYRAMWNELRQNGQWSGEIWNRRKNGDLYAETLSISAVYGRNSEVQNYVALFSDITEKMAQQARLEQIAYFDPLTGLPNRVQLNDRLQRAMAHAQRHRQIVALLYLDLDGFKEVNDRLGHEIGDQVLIEIARRAQDALRGEDTVARLGGDEFVAVLGDLPDTFTCLDLLPRLLAAIAQPMRLGEHTVEISASIGVSFYPQNTPVDAQQLLREADQAMYQAKLAGKNRYYLFDGGIKRGPPNSSVERLVAENS